MAIEEIPRVLIAGKDAEGNIVHLNATGGTLQVNTELTLTADNVTIGNIKTFADSTGTPDFALIDTSRRIVLAPTSTVQAVSAPGTGSTVEIGNKTGFVLSTTSTVPVSFATTSTVQVPPSGTQDVRIAVTTSTIPVSFATTSTVQVPPSGTQDVRIAVTTSTIPVSFSPSSTVQVAGLGGTIDVGIRDSSIAVPSDLQANYYTSVIVVSSATNVTTGSTKSSGDIQCADYVTKTVSVYASTASATITIQVSPSGTGLYRTYFTDGTVPANTLYTRSFTEAFDYVKVIFTGGTTASTLELLAVGLQTG